MQSSWANVITKKPDVEREEKRPLILSDIVRSTKVNDPRTKGK
jgi:hypothetical protein